MRENDYLKYPLDPGMYAFDRFPSFEEYERTAYAQMEKMLGLDRLLMQAGVPLNPRTVWERDFFSGHVEKIKIDLEGDQCGVFYFGTPKVRKFRTAFICLHGHDTGIHRSLNLNERETGTDMFGNDDCMTGFMLDAMNRGLVAVAFEQRYFGERSSSPDHRPSCGNGAMQALLIGRTAIGERVFDIKRLIKYLAARPEIDAGEIGLTGLSGGGTATLFAGAMLNEIKYIMPCGCFSSFRASIGSMPHCCCNHIPGLLNFGETGDIAGLCAPRKLVLVNGDRDPIFPIEACKEQFKRLQKIYAAAGAPEKCTLLIGAGEHRYFPDLAWPEMFRSIKPW